MRNYETGLEYANTDPSLHCNTIEKPGADWREQYLAKLMDRDYEAAHELRRRNDPKYAAEVDTSVTVLKTEHARLKSCRDIELEDQLRQEEAEDAAA